MKTFTSFVTTITCLVLFSVPCMAGQNIESKVGAFDFGGSLMSESELVGRFGEGFIYEYKVGEKVFSKSRTYYYKDEQIWVKVDLSHVLDENHERSVEAVTVTKKRLCNESYKPSNLIGPMITSSGIAVGDQPEKVIKVYGKPGRKIEIMTDSRFSILKEDLDLKRGLVFRYFPDDRNSLHMVEFYFQDSKLHSLIISISE